MSIVCAIFSSVSISVYVIHWLKSWCLLLALFVCWLLCLFVFLAISCLIVGGLYIVSWLSTVNGWYSHSLVRSLVLFVCNITTCKNLFAWITCLIISCKILTSFYHSQQIFKKVKTKASKSCVTWNNLRCRSAVAENFSLAADRQQRRLHLKVNSPMLFPAKGIENYSFKSFSNLFSATWTARPSSRRTSSF